MLIYCIPDDADRVRAAGHIPVVGHRFADPEVAARCDGVMASVLPFLSPGFEATWVFEEIPPRHPTEMERPQQVAAMMQMLMAMYRTHLTKNADYSPNNILVPGEIGLVTRLWDKTARLLNLYGFRFEVVGPGRLDAARSPQHEALDDTFMDLALYGIIGLLLRKGVWGK